jgi:UMF1 family MFS transporter
LYSIGVQTIILLTGIYGKKIGDRYESIDYYDFAYSDCYFIFGAYLFSRISEKIRDIATLKLRHCHLETYALQPTYW